MENVYRSDLEQGILAHDCVSFDLFDTLVMRRVPLSADVFSMVEQSASQRLSFPFCELRIRAERELREAGVPLTFEAIYGRLRELSGIGEQEMLALMQEERKADREVILARRDMADILRMAHDSGKTVTILADTYISGTEVRDLLAELEIRDYTMILSSADLGLNRGTGLYAHYRALCGEEKRFLHIGDNALKDGEWARESGINTLIIPRALDQYRRDNPTMTMPQDLNSRRILGEKIARRYNSPFA